MTTTWSLNSTSTLNGAPPVRKNTPSAIFSKSVRAGDGGAGPGSALATVTVAAPFGRTSVTVRSSVGCPPWLCTTRVGNLTPP